MRILTWNCRRGPLDTKLESLQSLSPDIAVVTEAPRPKTTRPGEHWFGEGALGVLVVAGGGYGIEPLSDGTGCVHHARVSGPRAFDLLAVWTWPRPSYLGSFQQGLAKYQVANHNHDLVIAGDLNGGPSVDRPRSRKRWDIEFATLADRGLVSAYHHLTSEAYGAERQSTHWHQGKQTPGFHIDYVFVPVRWIAGEASTTVGDFETWAEISDHAPVIVDL